MSTRMQQRRDTSTQWSLIDPVLAEGEIGFETDTGEFRLGDGTSTWSELSPFKNIEDLGGNLDDYIPLTQKAQDLGVATLDADGNVPLGQLVTALSTAQGYADTAETDAKAYADSLATNYDIAGAATTAQSNAQTFATNAINALDTDDIEEGTTNLYFTNQRALDATSSAYDTSGAASTAEGNANSYTDTAIGNLDTDDIEEGPTNKYFTDSRAQTATASNIATAKSEAIATAALDATDKADAAETSAVSTANAYTDLSITNLINAAPGTLDTLNELAAAIGDDPSFAVTVAGLVSDAQTDAQDFATTADSALYIQVTGDISTAVTSANSYSDSLAANYDAAGAAATAESNANSYTDTHNLDTTGVHGIADTSVLVTQTNLSDAVSTHSLDTTSVHGIADTSLLETLSGAQDKADAAQSAAETYADLAAATAQQNAEDYADGLASNYEPNNAVSTHNLDTTDVHGIADTSALATKTYADDSSSSAATSAVSTHNSDTTDVHGIADTAALATKAYADGAASTAQAAAEAYADALTTSDIAEGTGLYFTDERAQDAVGDSVGAGLSYDDASGSISVNTSVIQERVADVSDTEIGHLNGVTSGIQSQIDSKAPLSYPTFPNDVTIDSSSQYPKFTIKSSNASGYGIVSYGRADGNGFDLAYDNANDTFAINRTVSGSYNSSPVVLSPSGLSLPSTTSIGDVSSTEIGYVNGVTSSIQNQIDSKANLAGATFTGDLEIPNVTITGNLIVQGTSTTVNTKDIAVRDGMVYLNQAGLFSISNAVGNGTTVVYTTTTDHDYEAGDYIVVTGITPSALNIAGSSLLTIDSVTANTFTVTKADTDTYVSGGTARGKSAANPDLGFAAGYNDGTYHHTGFFRDATDGTWKLFQGYTPEPDESVYIDTNHASFELAPFEASAITSADITVTASVDFTGATITGLDLLPDQTGNNGKYLTTDGSTASWTTLNASPALDDLSDVAITSAATNDVVYFNGSSWENKNVSAIPTLINAQSGTTYTLALADAGKVVEVANASSITLSVPTDASVAFPIGTQITILQTGVGQITVSATTPGTTTVNYTPGNKTRAQWSSATLIKRAANTWVLIGDLA